MRPTGLDGRVRLSAKGRKRAKEEATHPAAASAGAHPAGLGLLVGALGVVYGDIGTSPLYAINEVFFGHHHLAPTAPHVLGAASLVFWSLVLVVTVKYVFLIMRADNHGEGGIFALLGLLLRREPGQDGPPPRPPGWVLFAVLAGAALLYGDGMITPAISVLSAVEGIAIVEPKATDLVIPVTLGILVALFAIQRRGTHRIGFLFGPVMAIWFTVLAALGVWRIVGAPEVLAAVNPLHAIALIRETGWDILWVLGAVVLCVTGVEAMYADMGHFGRDAIRRAWLYFVMPALMLNYFGQCAYLLSGAEVPRDNVFYALAPSWGVVPLVVLSTLATIIASQALVSGAFSLTQQAMALGLFPRVKVVHTNPAMPGQIYMPFINYALLAGCVWLVLSFRTSSSLAAAYGIAVTGTMVVTTISFAYVATRVWGWRKRWLLPAVAAILLMDGGYLTANALKFTQGGYVPVVIGFFLFAMMDTWRWGRQWIGIAYQRRGGASPLTLAEVLENRTKSFDPGQSTSLVVMASRQVTRVEDTLPPVFAVHYRNWKRVPKHIVFFSVIQVGAPFVDNDERYKVLTLSHDEAGTVVSVLAYFGYMEQPNVRKTLAELKSRHQLKIPQESRKWLILLGAERFVTRGRNPLEQLRISLFSRMNRLAKPVTDYFGLETDMGVTIETINV